MRTSTLNRMVGGSLYRVQEPGSANEMLKTIDKDWSKLVCRNLRAVTARSLANASDDSTTCNSHTVRVRTICMGDSTEFYLHVVVTSTYNIT